MLMLMLKVKNILFFMFCVVTLLIINTTKIDAYNLDSRKIVSNIETIEKLSKDIKSAIETEIAIRDAKIQELQEKINSLNNLLIQKTNENKTLMTRIQELENQQMEIKRFFKKLSTLDTAFINENENISFTESTEKTRSISQSNINIQKQEQDKDISFRKQLETKDTNKPFINPSEQTKTKISYTPSSQKTHFDNEVKKGNLLKMISNLDLESQMDSNYSNAIVAKIKSNNSIYYYIDKAKIMGAIPIK